MKNASLFICLLVVVVAATHLSVLQAEPASGAFRVPINTATIDGASAAMLIPASASTLTPIFVPELASAAEAFLPASLPVPFEPASKTVSPLANYLASASLLASANFDIPVTPPETVITARSMHVQSGTIKLIGEVRAIRGTDILTCDKAYLQQNPDWMLATHSPRFYRKESVPEKKSIRESTLDALNILWSSTSSEIEASSSVTLKIEERTWDMATYTWAIISSDYMVGNRKTNHMKFSGNVTLRDKTTFGKGEYLDYDKASSTVILTGDARIEREKYNEKEKKMVKDILTGEIVTYNLNTKQATSE